VNVQYGLHACYENTAKVSMLGYSNTSWALHNSRRKMSRERW